MKKARSWVPYTVACILQELPLPLLAHEGFCQMVATSGEEVEGKGRAFLGVSSQGDVSACLNQLIPHIQCVMKQGANLCSCVPFSTRAPIYCPDGRNGPWQEVTLLEYSTELSSHSRVA